MVKIALGLIKKHSSIALLLIALGAAILGSSISPDYLLAQEDGDPCKSGVKVIVDDREYDNVAHCLADNLNRYMNTALEGLSGDPANVRLLSPAFNLTSPCEQQMRDYMVDESKVEELPNWSALDGWAGNTYTVGDLKAMAAVDGNGWRTFFTSIPKDYMVFTEFGLFFNKWSGPPDAISQMKIDLNGAYAASMGGETIINYFDPFASAGPPLGNPGGDEGTDSDFKARHDMTDAQISEVMNGGYLEGLNPGLTLDVGKLPTVIDKMNLLGMGSFVTITTSKGDSDGIVNAANLLHANGIKPIFRICTNSGCGYEDPLLLADMINEIDSRVPGPTFVIVGPNEPFTERWFAPECGEEDRDGWAWTYVSGCTTADSEFHSLRPYPGNPQCAWRKEISQHIMCGSSIIPKENFKFYLDTPKGGKPLGEGHVNPDNQCTEQAPTIIPPIGYQECYIDGNCETLFQKNVELINWLCPEVPVVSEVAVTVDLTEAELPVVGNTEDVPNASSSVDSLPYAVRMNNYLSWYLQGVDSTAEEPFGFYGLDPTGVYSNIDYAGPLQKLYPFGHLVGQRTEYVQYPVVIRRIGGNEEKNLKDKYKPCGTYGITGIPLWCKTITETSTSKVPDMGERRNQIVVCTKGFPEACYIAGGQNRLRRDDVKGNTLSVNFPYIPMSSTDDLGGWIYTVGAGQQPGSEVNEIQFPPPGIIPTPYDGIANFNPYYLDMYKDPVYLINRLDPNALKTFDQTYYAHVKEVIQLATALQYTYLPEVYPAAKFQAFFANGMPPVKPPNIQAFCQINKTFTNPGDNLYGWLNEETPVAAGTDVPIKDVNEQRAWKVKDINGALSYAGTYECEFHQELKISKYSDCRSDKLNTEDHQSRDCVSSATECLALQGDSHELYSDEDICATPLMVCYHPYTEYSVKQGESHDVCFERHLKVDPCEQSAFTAVDVQTQSPQFGEMWNRLVNGNWAIFRRIYPRLYPNNQTLPADIKDLTVPGPTEIENIPGETGASYSSSPIRTDMADYAGGDTFSGPPQKGLSASNARLYFPYLGSLHQYFLVDIQTALWPFGISDPNIYEEPKP